MLPAKIAAGEVLTEVEVEQARTVLASCQADGSSEQVLARRLLGGDPMVRAVTAAPTAEEAAGEPAPGPHTGAMVALVPTEDEAAYLDVADGLPADELHITLAFLGPADQIDDETRSDVVSLVSKAMEVLDGPIPVEFTHIDHFGPGDEPAAVAMEVLSPELHEFRRALTNVLRIGGVEYSDRWAFRPHMTITYLDRAEAEAEWPPGPLEKPPKLEMSKILIRFGQDQEEILTIGSETTPESSVTAAAAAVGYPLLSQTLDALNGSLQAMDVETSTEIRTAIDYGWRSALDRVGRMATRAASAEQQTRWREMEPAAVAAQADVSNVNVLALIEPAVADAAAHVQRVTARTHAQIAALIEGAFGVDLDDVFPDPVLAGSYVTDQMTSALLASLDRLGDSDRIDPTNDVDPLVPPFALTRDVLAMAGGAEMDQGRPHRDGIGRPLQAATAGADSIALGPGPVAAVRDSILSYFEGAVAAGARRRAGALISEGLRSELSEVSARMAGASSDPPLEQVTVHTWRLNWNGRAQENMPRHAKLAGTTIVNESELQQVAGAQADPGEWPGVAVSHPGDHRYCHCGWQTRIELQPVQLALTV